MHGLSDLLVVVEFVLFPRVLSCPLALWLRESDPEDVVRLPSFSAFCQFVRDDVCCFFPRFEASTWLGASW